MMHAYVVTLYIRSQEFDFNYSRTVRDQGLRGIAYAQSAGEGAKSPHTMPREPLSYFVDDENEANSLAKVLAEKHPGESVLVSQVLRSMSCPPGQLKISELSDKGLLPKKGF